MGNCFAELRGNAVPVKDEIT